MYRQEASCSELKLSQLTRPCPSCMLRVEDLGPMSCEKWTLEIPTIISRSKGSRHKKQTAFREKAALWDSQHVVSLLPFYCNDCTISGKVAWGH